MGLRKFKIPDDAQVLEDILPKAFQYPENPEWSLDENGIENVIETGKLIRRVWWIIKLLGYVWKPATDLLHGYVWEEDGQPVGIGTVARQGASQQWMLANAGVLPEYRRQGIGRKLAQARIDLAIGRGAKQLMADIVDGNIPNYELYKSLGFTHFTSRTLFEYTDTIDALPEISFLAGYQLRQTTLKEWKLLYDFVQRLTPASVQEFEPVAEGRYKMPAIIRFVHYVVSRLIQTKFQRVLIKDANGNIVGFSGYEARKNDKGIQSLHLVVDKEHAIVSQPLLIQMVREIRQSAPTAPIQLVLSDWQYEQGKIDPTLIGFKQKLTYHRLGLHT